MFTGIIDQVGTVTTTRQAGGGLQLDIVSGYDDLHPGESVAIDGACLTVEAVTPEGFRVHLVPPSLERTNFRDYPAGRRVNLERALRVGDRLGGHLVQGHVDARGTVLSVTGREDLRVVDLSVPDEVARLSVPLGSVTVDGVSLTVNAKPAAQVIQVSLIPFTLQHTTLGERRPGDRVHLEADAIGKYVWAFLGNSVSGKP